MALLYESSDWTFENISRIAEAEREIVEEELKLDYYPFQIEVITAEQMIDAYTSIGLPVLYKHWSFGKHFLAHERRYKQTGGLAYELVINTNPCHVYCMETNTATMQALVIAHAAFGHNSFFKGNHLFKQWTYAEAILDYLVFARHYIAECEERHGIDEVEVVLDACHALMNYGVDRYSHPLDLSLKEEEERQKERAKQLERDLNILWNTLPKRKKQDEGEKKKEEERFPKEPQENILYFIEKYAPNLPPWKREVIRIVRKIGQYFYPQRLTSFMNEGYATFVHYYIMNRLYEKGLISDGAMFEFLHNHTGVAHQWDMVTYINPYDLCFKILLDIRRMCEIPTAEDRKWFPDLVGSDWRETIFHAVTNFKDESFVLQYLSPKVMRDFHMFSLRDDDRESQMIVSAIHRDDGYEHLRRVLASHYDLGIQEPIIEVQEVAVKKDRTLTLRYQRKNRRLLVKEEVEEVLLYLHQLWEFPVALEVGKEDGTIKSVWRVENGKVVDRPR